MPTNGEKFKIGQTMCTREVDDFMRENDSFRTFVRECLFRHAAGDWGNLCGEDKQENDRALLGGSRLISAYKAERLPKIWIVTEADRSATTILFPKEY